jgi:ATP-binding cassette, subfamily F, member 3
VELKSRTLGSMNIRKGSTIGFLKQIYEKEQEDIIVEEYLKESFKEYMLIENRLRGLEDQMSKDTQNLELILQKYGKLQEKYIALGGFELEEKFKKICSGFKFDSDFLKKKYNSLSGGEKTMVNLATILLKNPSILLLDEPTNHLDVETLEWLEKFLIEYKGTILLISHDRYFLDKVATKTILLENGHTKIYFGNYSYFLKEDERRTLAEFEMYKTQQKQIEKMKESIKKLREFGRLAGNEMFFKRAKSIEKRLEKMDVLEKRVDKKLPIKINSCSKSGKDILVIKNLNKCYGENVIFKNFNMEVFGGEKVQLKGKNGSGKSTLIKIILGKDNDFSGDIKINPSVKIGYIPQEIKFSNEADTILEYFLKNYRGSETEARTFLAKYMFYGENVFKRLKDLSGGERVRLLIAELVIKQTNFLILDEPTNHLDISTREILEENLKEYKGTILFVSHDRYFANKIAEREINI